MMPLAAPAQSPLALSLSKGTGAAFAGWCFDKLSMSGNSQVAAAQSPLALSLSKGTGAAFAGWCFDKLSMCGNSQVAVNRPPFVSSEVETRCTQPERDFA